MYCPKCGNLLKAKAKFCNKCGCQIYISDEKNLNQGKSDPNQIQYTNNQKNQSQDNKKMIFIGVGLGLGMLIISFLIVLVIGNIKGKYYFNVTPNQQDNETNQTTKTVTNKGKYTTKIIYDHTYSGVKIKNDKDALALIEKDSVTQKDNCPTDIKKVEDEIIKNYGITAVNLCEMDIDFAKELGNVFKKIYTEYPSVRGYITNLTLVNVSINDNYIAAFMPVFNFATSDASSTYPWVIKTQVLLNTAYFLNKDRLQASVTDGSNSGHFPDNSTIYSPVAHELGHYLSFLAMMKHYQLNSILLVDSNNINTFYQLYEDFGKGNYSLTIINEAFENYKKDTNATISLDEWRGNISNYALAKNNSGEYIYDETIAESFHDVYLNGDNAADASKYIVSVLKQKLGS